MLIIYLLIIGFILLATGFYFIEKTDRIDLGIILIILSLIVFLLV